MAFYFSGATAYGIFLIYRMFQDRECCKRDLTSWTIIAIASLFWIVVIPISIVELQTKYKYTDISQQIESETETSNSPLVDC